MATEARAIYGTPIRAAQHIESPAESNNPMKRIVPLGAIVLLHVGLLYVLRGGLAQPEVRPVPKEVFASFVAAEPVPEPPKPQAELPKPAPAPKPPEILPPKPKVPVAKPAPRPPVAKKSPEPLPKAPTTDPAPSSRPEPQAAPAAPAPAPTAPPSPTPATPVAPAAPRTVTSGIAYLQPPQLEYPALARRMGEEGTTVLRVLVDDKGRPERIEVQKSSGSARLDDAARRAVARALFKPFIDDGRAVAAFAIVPIKFQLDN